MANSVARILQITDLHLYDDKNKELLGVNTFKSFHTIIDAAFNDAEKQPPQLVMFTGDLSQDNTEQSYKTFIEAAEQFNRFHCPIAWIPGNHDFPKMMNDLFNKSKLSMKKHFILESWQVIFLNTHVPEEPYGILEPSEFEHLEKCLKTNPNKYTLVVLHHHVLPVGCEWLDQLNLKNANVFLSIIKNYPNVKGVICGHVHQASDQEQDGVRFISTPSTCIQFKTMSKEFAVEEIPPAYRWITLSDDGSLTTELKRLKGYVTGVDLESPGY